MNYGKIMKEIRNLNKSSQKEIAEILNLSYITYSHYETQDTTIPIKHLNAFCNYYNIGIDYIFELTNNLTQVRYNKEIDKKLMAKRIKEFRKDHNLTQEKLASILNVSGSTVAGYECGTNIIATPFLYDLCKKYDVSADYILGRIDYNPKEKNLV